MLFLNKTFIGYLSTMFLLLIIFLYFYRRIANLQCYNNMLEKKNSNLKKENSNLKEKLNYDKNSVNDNEKSENEFLKIFSEGECDIINNIYITDTLDYLRQDMVNKCVNATSNEEDKCVITELEDLATETVENTDTNTGNNDLPIANHIITADNAEVESVLSEDNSKYTKKGLSKMNIDKIRDICNSMNISSEGTKNLLIDKILQQ